MSQSIYDIRSRFLRHMFQLCYCRLETVSSTPNSPEALYTFVFRRTRYFHFENGWRNCICTKPQRERRGNIERYGKSSYLTWLWYMVFNATFNNISVILTRTWCPCIFKIIDILKQQKMNRNVEITDQRSLCLLQTPNDKMLYHIIPRCLEIIAIYII